ncbi:MAG: hypothetical protein FWF97_04105 [Alphaproteobacteria bacterium]|nr:hypothetical protein [Alphaproteobacteria bacterium]
MKELKSRFEDWLGKQGLKPKSIANYVSTVNSFRKRGTDRYYEWEELADNIFDLLHNSPHVNKKNQYTLTLFNEFLYDIEYRRPLIWNGERIEASNNTDIISVLGNWEEPTANSARVVGEITDKLSGSKRDPNVLEFHEREVAPIIGITESGLRKARQRNTHKLKSINGGPYYHRNAINRYIYNEFFIYGRHVPQIKA